MQEKQDEQALFLEMSQEKEGLKILLSLEDLAEKKTKIFSRLLMDAKLAGEMEQLSLRHEERKERIEKLLFGKAQKKKTDGEQGSSSRFGRTPPYRCKEARHYPQG